MAERLEQVYIIDANGTTDENGNPARIAQLGQHRIIAVGPFDSGTLAATEYSTTTGDSGIAVPGFTPLTADGAYTISSPYYQLSLAGATAPSITVVVTPIISRDRGA
jgi:hypothetical protein